MKIVNMMVAITFRALRILHTNIIVLEESRKPNALEQRALHSAVMMTTGEEPCARHPTSAQPHLPVVLVNTVRPEGMEVAMLPADCVMQANFLCQGARPAPTVLLERMLARAGPATALCVLLAPFL